MKNHNREKATSILKLSRIIEAPVDVKKVAQDLGFMVVDYPFNDKRKGMIHIQDRVKIIGINSKHPIYLQRFTIAHELGHYLNGHSHYTNTFIDDEKRFYDPHFHQEKEADLFASELLMPKDFLESDLQKLGLDLPKLTELYQVSEQALWIRLTTLNLAEKYSK